MPICRNCHALFPNRIKIDGKIRVLSSRRFCLTCTPFGTHNTKKKVGTSCGHYCRGPNNDGHRICQRCGRAYVLDRYNRQGHTSDFCNSCTVNTRRLAMKLRCLQYLGGKCDICGYSKCHEALAFHHKDPSMKEFILSRKYTWCWERLQIELNKCRLLCFNCHIELHAGIHATNRNLLPKTRLDTPTGVNRMFP